uniref:Deoxyribonuclease II n=1 Tax=Angiostrongylus cantonensis TaxID=6313 RepID=A0A0K0D8J0_ANGCA
LEQKHKCCFVDLWHDLIASSLRTPLGVETWRNGAAKDIGSQCGDGANVYDVTKVQLPSGNFSSSKDHSKWGVSMKESMPYTCIGDINRQTSQFKRGGGAACIQSKALWTALYNSVVTFEGCNING